MRTKIIDATSSSVIVRLTPVEAQDHHIICKGYNQVDIYLPTTNHYRKSTKPITISRDKINQPVFIHCLDSSFQNQFDITMTTISLDMYYSRTFKLLKEDRTNIEWYIISNGLQGYNDRSITAEIYGTSIATEGTQAAYFFEGYYQTSQTSTSYPTHRSYLYDHSFMDSKISTARDEVHVLKPGYYTIEHSFNILSESTETTTFRFRLRNLNDYQYDESSHDIYLIADPGTHSHCIYRNKSFLNVSKTYSTHTAFNTSGAPYDKYVYGYDIVVEGNGTWYFGADLPENSNASWTNKIKYTLEGDPDLAFAVMNATSFV